MDTELEKQMSHIEAQDLIIKSLRIENNELKKEKSKMSRFHIQKVEKLESELKAKQEEINTLDEMHYEECAFLHKTINELKKAKGLN